MTEWTAQLETFDSLLRELSQNLVHTLIRNGPKEAVHSINDAKIYYNKFNREIAEKDLAWAINRQTTRTNAQDVSTR